MLNWVNKFEFSFDKISLTPKISKSGLSSSLISTETSVTPSPGIKFPIVDDIFYEALDKA